MGVLTSTIFSAGKVVLTDTPKGLFGNVDKILSLGLDVPFTAKIAGRCLQNGVAIDCDYTATDFVKKTLEYIKAVGDVASETLPERGDSHA